MAADEAGDFEAPLIELQKRIDELAAFPGDTAKERSRAGCARSWTSSRAPLYARLTPWQKTQVARHPNRPYTLDYVGRRSSPSSPSCTATGASRTTPRSCAGFAFYKGRPVAVIGHQKGRDTKQKIYRNFGMPKPEGYRKALRVMQLAAKFRRPIITFVDTPGAYPGLDAEERGQAEAIAYNLREMARLPTPIVVNVTGEGGSGGALAIAVGRPRQHAGALRLLGDHAGGLRLDPVARRGARGGGGHRDEDHGGGPQGLRHHGRDHPGAAGRRPRRPGGAVRDARPRPGSAAPGAVGPAGVAPRGRYEKFRRMGRLGREFLEAP